MSKMRQYTIEFKQEAVKLVKEHHYSQEEVSRRLGVSSRNINRWVKEFGSVPSGTSSGNKAVEARELERLRKENHTLKLEREILKKAAAFFAKEND
jgi:transposase